MPRRALTLTLALLTLAMAAPAFAGPKDTQVSAIGLAPADFRDMNDPVVIDRARLQAVADSLSADVATLERMLELVSSRRDRKALGQQVQAMNDRLAVLRTELRAGAPARKIHGAHARRPIAPAPVAVPVPVPAPVVEEKPRAATGAQIAALSQSLKKASFRKDKMRVIRLAAPGHHFTTAQVKELSKHFAFGSDRVEMLALVHPNLIDPENTHTLFELLSHASDRRKLEARISGGQ